MDLGAVVGSENRGKRCATLCFIAFFSLIQVRENVMEVLQTSTRDTVTGYHLKSESLNLFSFAVKRILGDRKETNICLPTETSR